MEKTLTIYSIKEYNTVGGEPRTIINYLKKEIAQNVVQGIASSRKLELVGSTSGNGEGFKERWADSKGNLALKIEAETLVIS